MLETLITSKTRIKLLLKFFLNSNNDSYLRGLESEFSEGSNAIRMELNRFQEAGLLQSSVVGNKKMFKANKTHPLFSDLHNLVKKYIGLDKIVESIAEKAGDVNYVYVVGRIAQGLEAGIIELVLVGEKIDKMYLTKLIDKVEGLISRKITFVIFDDEAYKKFKKTSTKRTFLLYHKK
jgi:hypothetical protein